MTVRNLMSGYTAYTDARELAAVRGADTHEAVTTTGEYTSIITSTTVYNLGDDLAGQGDLLISVNV